MRIFLNPNKTTRHNSTKYKKVGEGPRYLKPKESS